MIAKGADDWNDGLDNACTKGHKELAELMILKGADNLNEGLDNACCYNYEELVAFMIASGADHCICSAPISEH